MHATAPEFDEKEDVQRLQPSGLDGEEVTRNHLVFVVLEKSAPTAPVLAAFGCRRDTLSLQYIADGRAADVMSELAQLALDLAVAPSWVLLRQPQDQGLEFGTRWRTAPQRSFLEGPFSTTELAVPFEQCLRFEQENNLTKPSTSRGRHRGQLSSQDDQGELLPAGNAWRAWLFALENAELLAEEQEFDILVMVSLSAQSDEVEEEREDVCHKEKGHADWRCRDRAEQRKQTMCGALKSLWRPSDAVSAPYGGQRGRCLQE